jgi:hypothetical protein
VRLLLAISLLFLLSVFYPPLDPITCSRVLSANYHLRGPPSSSHSLLTTRKPHSTISLGPPGAGTYFSQPQTGTPTIHLPKEIVRIDRDWSDGEPCQFCESFPLELEGRLQPHKWTEFISALNAVLLEAYSVRGAAVDNIIAVLTLWTSLAWRTSHFERVSRPSNHCS